MQSYDTEKNIGHGITGPGLELGIFRVPGTTSAATALDDGIAHTLRYFLVCISVIERCMFLNTPLKQNSIGTILKRSVESQ